MKIGVITDIHEDVVKLGKVIKLADAQKCDELVCLGDIVGYDRRFYGYSTTRSAKLCLELIRSNCRWIVAGNHDLFAMAKVPSYSNGFAYPDSWFTMNAGERKQVSGGKVWCYEGDAPNDLDEADKIYLNSLPEHITASFTDITILFSHYIFPDFTGSTTMYIERNHQLNDHWQFMKNNKINFSFSGHSHTSFAGFAYQGKMNGVKSFLKAIHPVPYDSINLGNEMAAVLLPPLSGEKGRSGFSIIDFESMKLKIISLSNI